MVSKYLHLISLTPNQISSEVLLDNGHQGATVFQMQTSDHYVVFFHFSILHISLLNQTHKIGCLATSKSVTIRHSMNYFKEVS